MTQEDEKEEIALVRCSTSAGPFALKLHRHWSPHGYDRAVELFERGFFDNSHFFRVVPKFLVQFGISYSDDKELKAFAKTNIPDDPQLDPPIAFHEGILSYAGGGDNSRTSQMFISYGSAANLGKAKWETPVGEVIEGMENIRNFYSYGDMPPWGKGPVQGKIHAGPEYIEKEFPKCDRFEKCSVERIISQNEHQQNQEEKKPRVLEEPRELESFAEGGATVGMKSPKQRMVHRQIKGERNNIFKSREKGAGPRSHQGGSKLRNPRKTIAHALENPETDYIVYSAVFLVVGLVVFAMFGLGRRKKHDSKTS